MAHARNLHLNTPEDVNTMSDPLRERVMAFLDDIEAACIKHHVSISHEDCHGSFILVPYKASENLRGSIIDGRLTEGA